MYSWLLQVDRDGSGTISLREYFAIFEEHGVKIKKSEIERWSKARLKENCWLSVVVAFSKISLLFRVHKVVGPDGLLKKDDFIKIIQSSNFFMKTFDKNQDGIVTEVGLAPCLLNSSQRSAAWNIFMFSSC